jgi:fructose-1,6-bisphosphatase/inositol monophosphatase family enzyme
MITPTLHAAGETSMREDSRDVILPHYQSLTAAQIVSKAVNDVVTVADQESEAILTERLTALLPDASVVGEEATFADESELLKLKDRLCWIVDPLDGTNNFAAG